MGHKVFIVEDEPDLKDTLKYNLENEGFSVKAFSSGEAFLGSLDKNKPNLVILDLMLPGVSGLDVCRELRSNENYDGIGIVMLTAKSEEIDRIVGFELGADDYVTKPFSFPVLEARIQSVLRRGKNDKIENEKIFKVFLDEKIKLISLTPSLYKSFTPDSIYSIINK